MLITAVPSPLMYHTVIVKTCTAATINPHSKWAFSKGLGSSSGFVVFWKVPQCWCPQTMIWAVVHDQWPSELWFMTSDHLSCGSRSVTIWAVVQGQWPSELIFKSTYPSSFIFTAHLSLTYRSLITHLPLTYHSLIAHLPLTHSGSLSDSDRRCTHSNRGNQEYDLPVGTPYQLIHFLTYYYNYIIIYFNIFQLHYKLADF